MNCDWEEFEQPDGSGWRRVRCRRCGAVSGKTFHALEWITSFPGCPAASPGSIGPGTALRQLLKQLGAEPIKGCGCAAKAREMDRLGADGCRREKERLVVWLKDAYSKLPWSDVAAITARAVASGLALKLLGGAAEGLIDEAIRLASERGVQGNPDR